MHAAKSFSRPLFLFLMTLAVSAVLWVPSAGVASAAPILSGRVYAGELGDESTALVGVRVELYGSNDLRYLGELIDWTTTDRTGWYGLDAEPVWEFYNILEVDPAGYQSVGARTVDGEVIDANRIRYAYPLGRKTLTGNRFWDRRVTAATATRTATRPAGYTLSGRAYAGELGDESSALPGVTVQLYASNDAGWLGNLMDQTTTDPSGWYGLQATDGFEFYTIREIDPVEYESVGATTVGGTVIDHNNIRYAYPLQGKTLTGNKFWDR
jgi:hypothetical protein